MSASEKLKALEERLGGEDADVGIPLPQIVAVVEAAEAVKNAPAMRDVDTIPVETYVSLRQRTAAALTALEEALS